MQTALVKKARKRQSQRADFFWPSLPSSAGERHYGCFMLACRIPLKRLMSGSLSQPRTRYPPAACSDLVNEFISSVPHSSQPLCRVGAAARRDSSAKTTLQRSDDDFASWFVSFVLRKLSPKSQLLESASNLIHFPSLSLCFHWKRLSWWKNDLSTAPF